MEARMPPPFISASHRGPKPNCSAKVKVLGATDGPDSNRVQLMLCILAFTVDSTMCIKEGSHVAAVAQCLSCHGAVRLTAAKFVPAMLSTMESAMMSPRLVSRVRTTEDGEPSSSTAV